MTDYLSGADIAEILDITAPTWGRWVAAGKAPEPVVARDNMKLYARGDILTFIGDLNELNTTGENQ